MGYTSGKSVSQWEARHFPVLLSILNGRTTMSTASQTKYFDLHILGIGYVNRIREVKVKRGENFWACDISALHGAEDDVQYTRFDCRVSGSEAGRLIKRMHKACQEEKKILISFKLGDLYTDTFTYESGNKQGETGVSLKARLLLIHWIKVDGVNVYTAPPKAGVDNDVQSEVQPLAEPSQTGSVDMAQAAIAMH
jgi:CRISPR/Cas system-associated endoribonuclease Cas2